MTSSPEPRPERQAAIDAFNLAVEQLEADASTTAIARLLVRLPSACLVKDKNARITFASPEYSTLFGCQDPIGCFEHELLPPDLQVLSSSTDDVLLRRARTVTYTCNVSAPRTADRFYRFEKTVLTRQGETVGIASITTEVADVAFEPDVQVSDAQELPGLRQQYNALDARERKLASLLSHGAVNKNLAMYFDVSVRSIENWRRSLLTKLKIDNIPELTRWVVRAEDIGLLRRS